MATSLLYLHEHLEQVHSNLKTDGHEERASN